MWCDKQPIQIRKEMKQYVLQKPTIRTTGGTDYIIPAGLQVELRSGVYTAIPSGWNFQKEFVENNPDWFIELSKRPELGAIPKFLWDEQRIGNLTKAIYDCLSSNMQIRQDWIDERAELLKQLRK